MSIHPTPDDTVVVMRALGLGDALTGVPALRLLRKAFPDKRIVLLGPSGPGALIVGGGMVDVVVHADETTGWSHTTLTALGALRPAIAVNLHGSGPQSHRRLSGLEPSRLIAFQCRDWQGPPWRDNEHEVMRWCRLIRETFPWVGRDETPSVVIDGPTYGPPGLTVIHPGAAAASRRWPLDRYTDVARELLDNGHDVVVSAGPGEAVDAQALAAAAGARVLPSMSVARLHGLLRHARLLVSGDTGVAHLGIAACTPSVVLYGPVSPRNWGPMPAHPRHQVLFRGNGTGDPHGAVPDPALLRITVSDVLAACDRAQRAAGTARASRDAATAGWSPGRP